MAVALVRTAIARGWRIPRAAVMANHVHCVVTECPPNGPVVRRALKGASQERKLAEVIEMVAVCGHAEGRGDEPHGS